MARIIREMLMQSERELQSAPRFVIYNGTFTITGPRGRRTFKVSTVQDGPLEGKRILSVLNGPDNYADYLGVAFIAEDYDGNSHVRVWSKHRGTQWEILAKSFYTILSQNLDGYEVTESSTCRRCNRKLTVPTSIHSGYGPECANKL